MVGKKSVLFYVMYIVCRACSTVVWTCVYSHRCRRRGPRKVYSSSLYNWKEKIIIIKSSNENHNINYYFNVFLFIHEQLLFISTVCFDDSLIITRPYAMSCFSYISLSTASSNVILSNFVLTWKNVKRWGGRWLGIRSSQALHGCI